MLTINNHKFAVTYTIKRAVKWSKRKGFTGNSTIECFPPGSSSISMTATCKQFTHTVLCESCGPQQFTSMKDIRADEQDSVVQLHEYLTWLLDKPLRKLLVRPRAKRKGKLI